MLEGLCFGIKEIRCEVNQQESVCVCQCGIWVNLMYKDVNICNFMNIWLRLCNHTHVYSSCYRIYPCMWVCFGVRTCSCKHSLLVCVTSHLHVSAAHSYKRNSRVHKVLKSWGLARRLWLQLSPWQRQPVERLCLRAPFIVGRSNVFISSRANASISLA